MIVGSAQLFESRPSSPRQRTGIWLTAIRTAGVGRIANRLIALRLTYPRLAANRPVALRLTSTRPTVIRLIDPRLMVIPPTANRIAPIRPGANRPTQPADRYLTERLPAESTRRPLSDRTPSARSIRLIAIPASMWDDPTGRSPSDRATACRPTSG